MENTEYYTKLIGDFRPRDKKHDHQYRWRRVENLEKNMFRSSVEGYSNPALITTIA